MNEIIFSKATSLDFLLEDTTYKDRNQSVLITHFIEVDKEKTQIDMKDHKITHCHYQASVINLPFNISILKTGNAFIHLNELVERLPLSVHQHCKSIDYHKMEYVVCVEPNKKNDKFTQAFENEVKIMQLLKGKEGIVETIAILPDMIVQKQYKDGSLVNILQNNSLTESNKFEIALSLLKGLVALDQLEIVNLNICLENIFVESYEEDNQIKYRAVISEFGSAFHKSNKPKPISTMITPAYFSFELCRYFDDPTEKNLAHITSKTDVWSLGCVFFQLFFEKHLNWMDRLQYLQDINQEPKLVRYLDALLMMCDRKSFPEPTQEDSPEHIIWEMLRTNPENRIGAAGVLEKFEKIKT